MLLGDFAMWKDVAISGIWSPRFWIWFFMSLFCDSLSPSLVFWSAGRGFCCVFQLIFITGTHKNSTAFSATIYYQPEEQWSIPGLQEAKPHGMHTAVQNLHIADANPSTAPPGLGQTCEGNLPLFWLNPGYRQSCWELLEMPLSSLKYSPPLLDCGPYMTSPHQQHWLDLHLKQKPGSPRRLK